VGALLGILLLALVWRRLLLQGLVPIDGQTISFAYPTWEVLRGFLEAGRLPLWNPYRNLGEPLLADPQSLAAYPLFWLLAPLRGFGGFLSCWVILHSALAAGFVAALARRWYGDLSACAAAATLVALNGFFTARLTFPNHFAAAAWLPALLYFQAVNSPIGLGICLALQWLAGFPPFSMLSGVALLGLAAAQGRRGLRCLIQGGAWALGLAALQWVPFLELLRHSSRPLILPAELAGEFSASGSQLLQQLFIPQWYGWRALLEGDPAIVGFYVGLTALGLACFGLWRAAPRERWLGLASAAFLLLSLGHRLPGYAALIPLHVFRFPANWLLLATAGLALLCAAGVRRLPRSGWRWLALGAISLDLVLFAQSTDKAWAPESFLSEPPSLVEQIDELGGPRRIYHSDRLMQLWQRGTLRTEEDYQLMVEWLAPSYGMAFGVEDARSPQTLGLRGAQDFARRLAADPRLLDLAGIAWIIDIDESAQRVQSQDLRVWRNPGARPRISVQQGEPGALEMQDYAPGLVEASTRSDRPLRLVFAEVDYPGWRVTIDGEEAPHERVENLFLSLEVPPGSHRVTLSFSPWSVWLGLGLSALAVCGLAWRASARFRRR